MLSWIGSLIQNGLWFTVKREPNPTDKEAATLASVWSAVTIELNMWSARHQTLDGVTIFFGTQVTVTGLIYTYRCFMHPWAGSSIDVIWDTAAAQTHQPSMTLLHFACFKCRPCEFGDKHVPPRKRHIGTQQLSMHPTSMGLPTQGCMEPLGCAGKHSSVWAYGIVRPV